MTAVHGGTEQIRLARDGRSERIDVKIPAAIESGAKLRVRGKGGPGQRGGQPGDLILTVEVGAHPWFERDGLDLLVETPVSLSEAALGTRVVVPLLKGTVEVTVPPGSSSGRKLRVRDQGIHGENGRQGDLYVVLRIDAPESLSERARELLEELGHELKNPRDSAPWADQ